MGRIVLRLKGRALAVSAGVLFSTVAHADVVISSAATANMSCTSSVCAPTAKDAVLNAGDLETMLESGGVEITTTGAGGVQAGDIIVAAPLSWPSASKLALDAYTSITVNRPVSVVGQGGMTLTTDDGGSNSALSFGRSGHVSFQNIASALLINGQKFKLEGTLPALAADVNAKPAGSYALANNYDAGQDGAYPIEPMHILKGNIEGLGNAISRLSIVVRYRQYKSASLVYEVEQSGAIANLRLIHIRYRVIGLIDAAGLVRNNYGYLFGDEVDGTISARGDGGNEGGFVANNIGTIAACTADVNISTSGRGEGAGFVGGNDGTITLSRADGNISAFVSAGFVGLNEGSLSEDFATGAVNGGGGFANGNESDGTYTGSIENSYSTGSAIGGYSGGFAEIQSGGAISSSYSVGQVTAGEDGAGFACTGGSEDVSNDYWDTTTSGTEYGWCYETNTKGVTGLTSKQLRSGLPAGFDPGIWAEDPKINNGFPYLINNPPQKD
jgi:hypothetical protein